MITIIFILIIFNFVNADIGMLVYNVPGIYTILPKDYYYAKELIVELWGAGAGGDGCQGGGGGGGAYIKALIVTEGRVFNITVGQGGNGGLGMMCSSQFGYQKGFNGNSTFFVTQNIILTAGGGYASDISSGYRGGKGGTVSYTRGTYTYKIADGYCGQNRYCDNGYCGCDQSSEGNPFGGNGWI